MANDLDAIAETCLMHMERERSALQGTLETLRALRNALLAGDLARLQSLQAKQAEAVRQTTLVRGMREAIRERMAVALGLSATTTSLTRLAQRIGGPLGERLRLAGVQTTELATLVDEMNRSNANILRHCLGFTQRVLRDLTGGGVPVPRYGRDGTPLDAECGSLLKVRG